jgi:hypothetical protein
VNPSNAGLNSPNGPVGPLFTGEAVRNQGQARQGSGAHAGRTDGRRAAVRTKGSSWARGGGRNPPRGRNPPQRAGPGQRDRSSGTGAAGPGPGDRTGTADAGRSTRDGRSRTAGTEYLFSDPAVHR